ncbi:hypothetical protein AgCh_027899 [Apium graveolens]
MEALSIRFQILHLYQPAKLEKSDATVDRFSKAAHFGALPAHYTASKVAQLFMDIVGKLHSIPKSIVSDRDAIFLSKFWQELFNLQGTSLKMSSSYHPQTDGQTEIVNKCLQHYLRCFVSEETNSWHKFLGLAEWCYNTSFHSTIGQSPFEVVYGKPPPALAQYIPGTSQIDVVDVSLHTKDVKLQILKKQLESAQQKMKTTTDKHQTDKSFGIGDLVLVKLQPYRQNSVVSRPFHKLSKRYFGPFPILSKIEAAENEREVDELLTLNELRKSRRETREPNWVKDYYRGGANRISDLQVYSAYFAGSRTSEQDMDIDKHKLLRPKRMNFRFVEEVAKAKVEPDINPILIEVSERVIVKEKPKEPIPDVEWWDALLLLACNYDDIYDGKIAENKWRMEKITIYVEHPRPTEPPAEAARPPPQPLKLTKKEQKKLRTRRWLAREKDKQEMIRQGLIEPPKPKVEISNLRKVPGSEATQDPTRLEMEITSADAAERKQARVDRNMACRLTPDECSEKKISKLFDDPNTLEALVKTGGCAVISDDITVVVDEDEDEAVVNKCVKMWEGSVAKSSFYRFLVHKCRLEAAAGKLFSDAGVPQYWDLGQNFQNRHSCHKL